MVCVYKCLARLRPDYLASLTLDNPGRKGLRSATDATCLHVSKLNYRSLKLATEKTFAFAAFKLWNPAATCFIALIQLFYLYSKKAENACLLCNAGNFNLFFVLFCFVLLFLCFVLLCTVLPFLVLFCFVCLFCCLFFAFCLLFCFVFVFCFCFVFVCCKSISLYLGLVVGKENIQNGPQVPFLYTKYIITWFQEGTKIKKGIVLHSMNNTYKTPT